jgi:hypothetical protein
MSDFETHPIGTADELRCSRELADSIRELINSHGPGIVPVNVLQAYNRLYGQYIRQSQMNSL